MSFITSLHRIIRNFLGFGENTIKVKPHDVYYDLIRFECSFRSCNDHDNGSCERDVCIHTKVEKIISYVDAAKSSIYMAMYLITYPRLADIILKKFKQGVNIVVITDYAMSLNEGSQVEVFKKAGIPTYSRQSNFIMHYKFLIIDDKLVITGSLNWTLQALTCNYEDVTITNDPKMISALQSAFDEIFKIYAGEEDFNKYRIISKTESK